MSSPLPPFGIRGLCSPDKPFSVLQVSQNQYDDSIKSYPDAALTWLDEDDGEIITVGTGWELHERLGDPTSAGAPLMTFHDATTNQLENRYIHIFDVYKTQTNLNVWREHEAYWSKSQNVYMKSRDLAKDTAAQGDQDIIQDECIADPSILHSEVSEKTEQHSDSTEVPEKMIELSPHPSISPDAAAFPELLGSLATLLQSTSELLQRAATKTRDADTTLIEDILSGMTKIIGEAGSNGVDLLRKLDQTFVVAADGTSGPVPSEAASENSTTEAKAAIATSFLEHDLQRLSFTEQGDVDMSGHTCEKVISLGLHDSLPSSVSDSSRQSRGHKAQDSASITQCASKEQLSGGSSTSMEMSQRDIGPTGRTSFVSPSTSLDVSKFQTSAAPKSLLDNDAEDADFTARYPPLTTLRRAKTIGEFHTVAKAERVACDWSYASRNDRPSPQVFDVETQRRKDFARSCFPSQEYTPGLGPVALGESYTIKHRDSYPHKLGESQLKTQEQGYETPNIKINPVTDQAYSRLPGSWPDTNAEKLPSFPPSTQESSGAFFNRMMNELGSHPTTNNGALGNSVANLSRHRSLGERIAAPCFPNEPRRSQTTSATNPAARLNKPFDATYPILHEDPSAQPKHSPPGPVRSLHRTSADRRPRTLYEPYRPFSSHRSFSPVWEDHLKRADDVMPKEIKSAPPHSSGPVTVYASGFAQGSTARDISGIIEEHCKDHWGRSCLQECRVLHSEPVVTAKLVIKDSTVAEQIIAIFDKFTIGGRILRVGKNRLLIEHAARQHQRQSRRQESPRGLHRMRSVPAFATSARHSPPHINLTSRLWENPTRLTIPAAMTISPGPVSLTRPQLTAAVDCCERQLRDMGYGGGEPALMSRLHVYAAAASGDVEEAIELIEEDKNAHVNAAAIKEEDDVMRALRESR